VIKQLLRKPRVLEMKSFSCHKCYLPDSTRSFAAISFNASGKTVVFASTGMKFVSPFQRGTM